MNTVFAMSGYFIRSKPTSGFTLVELTLVLVLVGIISSLSIGLFANTDRYTASAARDQFVSSANLATKLAQSRSGSGESTTLTIDQTPDEWRFTVSPGNSERTAARRNAILSNTNSLTYSGRGQLLSGENQAYVFVGGASYSACVLASGFAFAGECPE